LQLQAACGSGVCGDAAGAKELGETELGMDAAERGSVVHKVLEFSGMRSRRRRR